MACFQSEGIPHMGDTLQPRLPLREAVTPPGDSGRTQGMVMSMRSVGIAMFALDASVAM